MMKRQKQEEVRLVQEIVQRKSELYNFPQGRVTDHRIKLTLHRLDSIMNGDLEEIIDSLIAADQAAKLSNLQGEE